MDAWLNKTIPQVLDERAAVRGDREALVIDGQRITYRQLQQESRRIARRLLASGFTPKSRVAVLMEASTDLLLIYYAICRIGAASVMPRPLYWSPRIEIARLRMAVSPLVSSASCLT